MFQHQLRHNGGKERDDTHVYTIMSQRRENEIRLSDSPHPDELHVPVFDLPHTCHLAFPTRI